MGFQEESEVGAWCYPLHPHGLISLLLPTGCLDLVSRGYLKLSLSKLTVFPSLSFPLPFPISPLPSDLAPMDSSSSQGHQHLLCWQSKQRDQGSHQKSLQRPIHGSKKHLREKTSNVPWGLITDLTMSPLGSLSSHWKNPTITPNEFPEGRVPNYLLSFMNINIQWGKIILSQPGSQGCSLITCNASGVSGSSVEVTVNQLNLKEVSMPSTRPGWIWKWYTKSVPRENEWAHTLGLLLTPLPSPPDNESIPHEHVYLWVLETPRQASTSWVPSLRVMCKESWQRTNSSL